MNKANKYKSMVFYLVATVLLNLHSPQASASIQTDSIVSEGNRYYMNREFNMAARCYADVVARGYESGELYYNLGNAYFKQDKLAEAILYYEKALLIKPGDEDIRQNLALANARIIDKIDDIPDFFLKRWMALVQGIFSPDQWAVLGLVFFIIALACFMVFVIGNSLVTKKAGFSFGIILLVVSMTSGLFMFARIHKIQQHNSAIIMVTSVNARSSPDEQSTNVFVLHEGTKVELTDSIKHWKEIRIADGNKGWVSDEVLGEI
jgi:tetratricopeptide (TPR) repeat protein